MIVARHIGIVVYDLEKMVHFYKDLLGLKVVKRMDESGSYIDTLLASPGTHIKTVKLSSGGAVFVELLYFHSHPGQIRLQKGLFDNGISHIAFTVKDIDSECKKLTKAGVLFVSLPQNSPDGQAKVAFCRDYEGNLLELVEELHPA